MPNGSNDADLPIGLHVISDRLDDAVTLWVAAAFEEATEFGRRRPPLYTRRVPI